MLQPRPKKVSVENVMLRMKTGWWDKEWLKGQLYLFTYLFILLWLSWQHVQAPRPGIEPASQQWPEPLQWQCWILNPLSQARDRTQILMDPIQVCYCWATTGTPAYFRLGVQERWCWSWGNPLWEEPRKSIPGKENSTCKGPEVGVLGVLEVVCLKWNKDVTKLRFSCSPLKSQ